MKSFFYFLTDKCIVLRFFVLLLLCFISCYSLQATSPTTFEEVKVGIEKQFAKYDLCEFTYEVNKKNSNGELKKQKNIYRLHLPQNGFPIQCLVEESFQDGEIERFVAFDGKQTCLYKRRDLLKGNRSNARIVATNIPEEFLEDSYARLLVTNIVGMPFTTISSHEYENFWKQKKDLFKFDSRRTLEGYGVLVFKSTIRDIEYEIHILEPPHFVIVGIKATNLKEREIIQDIVVQKIGKMEGGIFPQKGRIYQKFSLTHSPKDKFTGVDYSFDVLSVKRLDNFSSTEWSPEIPSGTVVKNDITGKTIEIPFSDKQKEMLLKHAEDSAPARYSPIAFCIRIILIVSGLVMIFLSIYWRLKGRAR
jgi:hypothetical protein